MNENPMGKYIFIMYVSKNLFDVKTVFHFPNNSILNSI